MYDLIAHSDDSLRYWHAKQMQDPVQRVAALEAMIMEWTKVRRGWPLHEQYLIACENLEYEGMRLWKLSWLPPEEPIKYLDEVHWWNRWTGEQM